MSKIYLNICKKDSKLVKPAVFTVFANSQNAWLKIIKNR